MTALPSPQRSRQHRLLAWLVLCVMFVQGLAPAIAARMTLQQDRAGWSEICSTSGSRWVRDGAAADDPAAPQPSGGHASCWACLVSTQGMAPPPSPLAAQALVLACQAPAAPLPAGVEPRPTPGLAAPRAPPRFS